LNAVKQIRLELLKYNGLKGIAAVAHLEAHVNQGEDVVPSELGLKVLRVSVPFPDDACVLFHRYGRILSRVCQCHFDKIEIVTNSKTRYYFTPSFRLSFFSKD
jgi:hypothetical protein